MFRTLLVPLDGSTLAESAVPLAEALAQHGGKRLILVRAALVRSLPGVDPTAAQLRAVNEAEEYLRAVAARLAERGLAVETAVAYGEAAQCILDEIRLRRAEVVVMATHGRSGLGRWVYGSVADAVLGHSPVPVLLVRAWQPVADSAEMPVLRGRALRVGADSAVVQVRPRLILPLDGSEFARAALSVAQGLARALNGRLVLLHVLPAPERMLTADGLPVAYVEYGREAADLERELEARRADAWNWLHQIAGRLALEPDQVQLEVRVGDAAEAIAAAGREHSASLVVMATHGRTGLSRLLLGSVASAVVRRGSVPVLLVRPTALPSALADVVVAGDVGPSPTSQANLSLDADEVALMRAALRTFGQAVADREHLQARIRRLIARLPSAEEEVDHAPANGHANDRRN